MKLFLHSSSSSFLNRTFISTLHLQCLSLDILLSIVQFFKHSIRYLFYRGFIVIFLIVILTCYFSYFNFIYGHKNINCIQMLNEYNLPQRSLLPYWRNISDENSLKLGSSLGEVRAHSLMDFIVIDQSLRPTDS